MGVGGWQLLVYFTYSGLDYNFTLRPVGLYKSTYSVRQHYDKNK